MQGVQQIFEDITVGDAKTIGVATLSKYIFDSSDNPLYNLRAMRDNPMMVMRDGKYLRLNINTELVMSDTKMEKDSNRDFVDNANGHVMIAGLGVGLIIHNIMDKLQDGQVKSITVYEKYQDVIDLVSPYYEGAGIIYKTGDILKHKPLKSEVYDTIYFDIWGSIDTENLDEIRMLHNRWKNRLNRDNPNFYMDSWMKKFLQAEKKREAKYSYY